MISDADAQPEDADLDLALAGNSEVMLQVLREIKPRVVGQIGP